MKTPYLESRSFWKRVLWATILIVLVFLMCGCVKEPDAVETAANAAHQQIVAIKESLPKECQTKAIDEQLKAHDATVETIRANCEAQKAQITSEKVRWEWSFFSLAFIVLIYLVKKILK